MARNQVTCINKTNRSSPYEKINHIGGTNVIGQHWKITQEDAIRRIESGTDTYYVFKGGHIFNIIVAKSWAGNKYLKTENDGDSPDNLLSLPECL